MVGGKKSWEKVLGKLAGTCDGDLHRICTSVDLIELGG